jgi:predicted O-linked N-acetylglucosamine transferase (SPINDLY family)
MTPDTIQQAIQIAVGHHQAGRLAAAEGRYRQVLASYPEHAGVLHLLGVLAGQTGNVDAAIELIGRAIAIDPTEAEYHANLSIALRRQGRLDEAIAALRQAVAHRPDHAEAHSNLGAALAEKGRFDEAILTLEQAVTYRPDYPEAHNNLGFALAEKGRLDEAVAALERALALQPDYPEAYNNLGNALKAMGRLDAAIAALGRAIALRPEYAEAQNNLGVAFAEQGRYDQAIAALRQALALRPDYPEAFRNLGLALAETGQLDAAFSALGRALALRPNYAAALSNLGNILLKQGRFDQAIDVYRRAIASKPDFAEAYSNLGIALKDAGRLDESVEALRRSIALRPDHAEVHNNLGSTLLAQGDREHALEAYHRALALRPSYFAAHSNVLMCEQYQSGVTLAGLARAHAEWDERHAAPYRAGWKPWDLNRDPERPLRLGFVSADLRRHPVGFFLVRVLENLDRRSASVICYHSSAVRDDMTDRLAAAANEWHDVFGLDDAALAARVRTDQIDILFDLAGHSANHRLLVFAQRPAPIQISWIGYVGTTGLKAMDYLIADRFHVPSRALEHYCERVLTMPDGYVCFEPPAEAPAVGPLPALGRGSFTFGSFNNLSKITPEVITLWAGIVRRVPGSRLLLVTPALDSTTARERIGAAFVAAGGDPARLELRGAQPRGELLAGYNTIDLALDPFPYSGGVTTCEALWMGVPVVTWPGETFAGRHSLSHLSNVGLTETVAANPGEYVELAVRLAADLPRLAAIRAGLRDRMARSPLCDGPRFARHLMTVLREVWRHWCRSSTR